MIFFSFERPKTPDNRFFVRSTSFSTPYNHFFFFSIDLIDKKKAPTVVIEKEMANDVKKREKGELERRRAAVAMESYGTSSPINSEHLSVSRSIVSRHKKPGLVRLVDCCSAGTA